VNVAVGSSGFCACDCGDGEPVEDAVFAACFAAYFWRFCTLDGVGLRTLYLEVMRVYKG
jgi:hypothetical protein